MAATIFGIRHHGPGSARRLVEALDDLRPAAVLIEGPVDATDMLPLLADAEMRPPVALLAYAADDPGRALFYPFATFSPEYQAALWAMRHGAALRFIDLPAADRLAVTEGEAPGVTDRDPVAADPIGALARAAGYEDGESWWRNVIEENPAKGPAFAAIADAMQALREGLVSDADETAREAHMRLEIAKAVAANDGPVAVVCGAWHVPALASEVSAKADREILKGRPKAKIKTTWAPWTATRLARESGYGAGVSAPAWCAHLWHANGDATLETTWLAMTAAALRDKGHTVATASVIEAARLARTLAALRDRPAAGYEELREAAIACLCHGQEAQWQDIAADLLVGRDVGAIPAATPLAPLIEDLQRQQKQARLKPEALERELAIDLRSEAGLFRSTLLHRLAVLDVPWGMQADAGRSRGTFRERWVLRWEPEFAVRLVENLVYGATVEKAATARLVEQIAKEADLARLAGLVRGALLAQADAAAQQGIDALAQQAAQTSDCLTLLTSLSPMADVIRYGEARTGGRERLGDLMRQVAAQGAIALPYAARGLDAEAATKLRAAIVAADGAIALAELPAEDRDAWRAALRTALDDPKCTTAVAGAAARLLYEADALDAEGVALRLGRALSPGVAVADAAGFFEGFFEDASQRLIHDAALRDAVDAWFMTLDEADFTANLPLFRRVLSNLDRSERRHLFNALFSGAGARTTMRELDPQLVAAWEAHFARVVDILVKDSPR